jgi:hypothetical protein
MIVKVRCESHYWFDSLSGHQSVYSISSLDLKGVSRVLTLRPALNRLGIAGMEQVSFSSNLVDFALGAITLHRES